MSLGSKTKPEAKSEHVVMGNNSLRCLHCGDEYHIDFNPTTGTALSLNMMAGLARGYADDHKRCKPSRKGEARFEYKTPAEWLASWDTGESSKTIYNFMLRGFVTKVSIPHDPSDFGRCYRLLKAFPAWRERLPEMGQRIAEWALLVAFWPELEQLFEEESPSGTCPKLYARMREING